MSVGAFLGDDHTDEISETDVMEGDIVTYWEVAKDSNGNLVYFDCLHSAIVNEIKADGSIVCESKWDEYGLYIHDIENVHDDYKGSVVLNGVTVGACFYRYYRYTQDEHVFYMYQDNGESGVTIKCNICDFERFCDTGVAEYGYGGQDGHYVDCTCGCYSFFTSHIPTIIMQTSSLDYHNVLCRDCDTIYPAAHSWIPSGLGYECALCALTTLTIPDIMQIPSDDELLLASSDDIVTEDALLPTKEDDLVTE